MTDIPIPTGIQIEHPDFELEFKEGHARFLDAWKLPCSISYASSIMPRIWIGADADVDGNKQIRMCLSRRQAAAIGRFLTEWAAGESDVEITSE